MKAFQRLKKRINLTVPSTIGFLLLACALVYLCIRIIGSVARSELQNDPSDPEPSAAEATETASEATPESLNEAALILVPDDETLLTPSGAPSETPSPAVTLSPSPTSSPTLRPVVTASRFNRSHMDVLLVGMDEAGHADSYAIIAVRQSACQIIFIPRNTLTQDDTPLSDAVDIRGAIRRLEEVFPVRFSYYVQFELAGLPRLIDAFGGVTIGRTVCSGEEAADYLESGGTDEMLRIERQQTVLRALLSEAQEASWFKLIPLKYSLADYFTSNLTLTQTTELYTALKRIGADTVQYSTLPVDSVTFDQTRCYRADIASMEHILSSLYQSE